MVLWFVLGLGDSCLFGYLCDDKLLRCGDLVIFVMIISDCFDVDVGRLLDWFSW